MDSERSDKYRALRQRLWLLAVGCWLLAVGGGLMSCTWVKDDRDDCPYGFWLQLHYTYNILDVEAAPEYVNDAFVYVYDDAGNYVKRIDVSHDVLTANDYKVRVDGLPEGDYQFVVWSGIGNSQYAVSGDMLTMDDLRVSLAGAGGGSSDSQLASLFHGYHPAVHYDDAYALYDVELTKNTNQLACLVVSLSKDAVMSLDDYTMRVVAANSVMDARNELPQVAATTYEPFEQDVVTIDDPDYGQLHGLRFSIMTLRLTTSRDSRIVFEKKSSGQTLFNISFPEYVGMIGTLYTTLGRPLSVQEYLDRQDLFTIVFYLSEDLDRLLQLSVNNWRLRANYHLKL